MMSCSIFGSNAVALATAMAALSGTVIFLAFCRENTQILGGGADDDDDDSPPQNQTLRSCLSSSDGKKEKKKRVRFAESVKEATRDGGESVESGRRRRRSCRGELISELGMPANRGALYSSMMRDRMNRMELSSSCC